MAKLYDRLNREQREAVFHTEGPLLILAGAGSGKTGVLTHRAVYLIEERGVKPQNILAITFTNKAAGEMRERIDRMAGAEGSGVWVSTFHALCVRILRRYIDTIGYERSFTIYDADDQKSLMKDVLKRLSVDSKIYKERSFLGIISHAKDELIGPAEYGRRAGDDPALKQHARVYEAYQAALKANNALDFDDLIMKCVETLRKNDEALEEYRERFKYIMVDEYQDTNTAQFRLVSLLVGKYRNLCVVGDDDQSIYKFRGANIHNILDFEKHFPEARVIRLEENYRSTKKILAAANALIRHNEGRREKTLRTQNDEGDMIELHGFATASEEARYIVKDIAAMRRGGRYCYKDCAVFYRTNAQSRILEEEFVHMNVPYRVIGGVQFYARREIKDLLAYLGTIENGADDLSVRRIINVPRRGIGAVSVSKVQDYAIEHGMGFYEALSEAEHIPDLGKGAQKIENFVLFVQRMKSLLSELGIRGVMETIIEETGYVRALRDENTEEGCERIENIDEFISKIELYEEGTDDPSLSGFLEEVALVAATDDLGTESDSVSLMTLHSAKGLEFPNVYISGMEEGLFPGAAAAYGDDPAEIEEERRLCYVGITRAKERLCLSGARLRMIRGETLVHKPSRFMDEIPDELCRGDAGHAEASGWAYLEAPGRGYADERGGYPRGIARGLHTDTAGGQRRIPPYYKRRSAEEGAEHYGTAGGHTEKGAGIKGVKGSPETLSYQAGDRVRHARFGEGTVTAIADGGRDYEVTVDFDRAGAKKMFAVFAKLEKI